MVVERFVVDADKYMPRADAADPSNPFGDNYRGFSHHDKVLRKFKRMKPYVELTPADTTELKKRSERLLVNAGQTAAVYFVASAVAARLVVGRGVKLAGAIGTAVGFATQYRRDITTLSAWEGQLIERYLAEARRNGFQDYAISGDE